MLPHKLKIITIVVSVFVYSCYASDGSVVSRLVDHTQQSTVHHQSNRPPESKTTKNGHHHSSSTHQQDSQQQQSQQKPTHSHTLEKSKSSYAMLSQAMSEAVHHEFNSKFITYENCLKWKFVFLINFVPLDLFNCFVVPCFVIILLHN